MGRSEKNMRDASVQDGKGSVSDRKRGWRDIEAWRDRKFLRESLAEIWDDDLSVDETMLSGDDSDVRFYAESEDVDLEDDIEDFEDEGFYDDEED